MRSATVAAETILFARLCSASKADLQVSGIACGWVASHFGPTLFWRYALA
jgi:hypothetical protein